jgi:hypothetical protein
MGKEKKHFFLFDFNGGDVKQSQARNFLQQGHFLSSFYFHYHESDF